MVVAIHGVSESIFGERRSSFADFLGRMDQEYMIYTELIGIQIDVRSATGLLRKIACMASAKAVVSTTFYIGGIDHQSEKSRGVFNYV